MFCVSTLISGVLGPKSCIHCGPHVTTCLHSAMVKAFTKMIGSTPADRVSTHNAPSRMTTAMPTIPIAKAAAAVQI